MNINDILNFIKSLVPYLPTLLAIYAVAKLLSSGMSIFTKVLSTLITLALCYWAVSYLLAFFA